MEIKTEYNIGDKAYFLSGMNIFCATIDNIQVKINKSFGKLDFDICYSITAHTNGYMNFIPSESPIREELLFKSEEELMNNIKIVK